MNPFRDTIVANPWNETRADVPEIHGDVFQQCLRGIETVRTSGESKGLLIHGEAGSGKTHLLSRLRGRLVPELPSATDRDENLFIWVRLQTSPRMIWRTLRRTLVDDWFRHVKGGHTQFQRILFHRLAEYRPAEWDLEPWYEYMLDEDPNGLVECLNKIADEPDLDLDRNTAIAFEHIAFKRHLRDLRAWLAGTSLPEEALDRIGFTQDEGTDEEREDEARRVVLMLCKLAGNGLPIVMSFDQVEALQLKPGDKEALFAYGQLISTLHDGATNLLLVSCVQSAFVTELLDHLRDADQDRMTENGKFSLDPLNRREAERLIAIRLEGTNHPAAPWPFQPAELESLCAQGDLTPRRLLNRSAEKFDDLTTGPTIEPPSPVTVDPVETFLQGEWDSTFEQKLAGNSPDRTEDIIRYAFPLLAEIVAPDQESIRDDELPDVALVYQGKHGYSGISICTQSNMNSLSARLKRLKAQFTQDHLQRLAIVRDPRNPISETATKTREHLSDLEQQGALLVHPTKEALAALDALGSLLSDSKSGDLAHRDQAIQPHTVEAWIKAHLTGELADLVDDLLGTSQATNGSSSDAHAIEILGTLLAETRVVSLDRAVDALQKPRDEVATFIQRHPGHFRLLGDPPSVLFEAVETTDVSR